MANIEGKLTHIQGMHAQIQGSMPATEVLEEKMQQIQQAIAQCAADISTIREQLEGLRAVTE